MDNERQRANRERIERLRSLDFGKQFREHNKSLQYSKSAAHRDTVYNAANKDFLEARKVALGVTNADILMIFDNLVGRVITDATLRRKLAGKSDFTATEIMVLARILELSPDEVLQYFNLYPNC